MTVMYPSLLSHMSSGALLAVVDKETGKQVVVAEAQNTVNSGPDVIGHAETNLVRKACASLPLDMIHRSILYTSTEPCAMCAGAIHWSGVPKVVYALPEAELNLLTNGDESNMTMSLPCREVFAHCPRPIQVYGPYESEEARKVHEGAWGK